MIEQPTLKQRIIAVFLSILLIGYVGNTCFFVHEHEVGDIKIVHSHPYSSSSHSHSTNSITTISFLSHVVALADLNLGGLEPVERLLYILGYEQKLIYDFVATNVLSLRAPPVL